MSKKLSEYTEKELLSYYENAILQRATNSGLRNEPFAPHQSRLNHDVFNIYAYGDIRLPKDLVDRALMCSGQHYVFEGRLNGRTHRTRQAVFKDLKKAKANFGIKENLSVHSLRKAYAVEEYLRSGGNLKKVQKLLNHDSEAVTMLYALANVLQNRKNFIKR